MELLCLQVISKLVLLFCLWPEKQSTAEVPSASYEDSRTQSWLLSDRQKIITKDKEMNTLSFMYHVYLWMPFNKCLCFLDIRAAPPQHAWGKDKKESRGQYSVKTREREQGWHALTSTCSHRLYFLQMSAICSMGSKAPSTVVPAVAFTMRGTAPWAQRHINGFILFLKFWQ